MPIGIDHKDFLKKGTIEEIVYEKCSHLLPNFQVGNRLRFPPPFHGHTDPGLNGPHHCSRAGRLHLVGQSQQTPRMS